MFLSANETASDALCCGTKTRQPFPCCFRTSPIQPKHYVCLRSILCRQRSNFTQGSVPAKARVLPEVQKTLYPVVAFICVRQRLKTPKIIPQSFFNKVVTSQKRFEKHWSTGCRSCWVFWLWETSTC